MPLVGYCRVSSRQQNRKGTLQRRWEHLEDVSESLDYDLVTTFTEVTHGWTVRRGKSCINDREALVEAIDLARRIGGGVLTHSWDRFVRHEFVKDQIKQKAPKSIEERLRRLPNHFEFDELLAWAGDVPLVTFLEPDASFVELKQLEQSFDITAKNASQSNGNRYQQTDKALLLELMVQDHRMGLSLRDMERQYGVSYQTIRRWLKTLLHSDSQNGGLH